MVSIIHINNQACKQLIKVRYEAKLTRSKKTENELSVCRDQKNMKGMRKCRVLAKSVLSFQQKTTSNAFIDKLSTLLTSASRSSSAPRKCGHWTTMTGPAQTGWEKMDICHQRGPSLRIFFSHVFFFLPYRTPLWMNFSFYRTLSETPKRSSSRRTSRIRIVSEQAFPAVSLQRDGKNQDGESGWIQMHSISGFDIGKELDL